MKRLTEYQRAQVIIAALVTRLVAAKCTVNVWSGGDEADLVDSTDVTEITDAINAVEMSSVMASRGGVTIWFTIIQGNGYDALSDHSTGPLAEMLANVVVAEGEWHNEMECNQWH